MSRSKRGLSGFSSDMKDSSKSGSKGQQKNRIKQEKEALTLLRQGKFQDSEVIYRKLIAAGSDNPDVYFYLGCICGITGRLKALIEFLKQALEIDPNIPQAHIYIGNALREQGDLDLSIASYEQALKLNSDNSEAHYNLGKALKDQGNRTAAIVSFKMAIGLNPNHPEAFNNLGRVLVDDGDLEAATVCYQKAIELKPDCPESHYNLGNVFNAYGNLDAAIASYQKAVALNPNYPEAFNNLGNVFTDQCDLESAITCYKQAIEQNPNFQEAYYNLGNTEKELGNLDAAIACYQNAIVLKPDYSDAYYNLGILFANQGDLDAAIFSYDKAIEFNSNYAEAHYNLGIVLVKQGKTDAAISAYTHAIKLNPSCPDSQNNLGIALKDQGDLDGAIACYKKAIELRLDNPEAYYNLGIAFAHQGDLGAAISNYKKALQLKPSYLEVYNNLGNVLAEQGDLDAAHSYYMHALKINPDYPEANWNLSLTMLLGGDYKRGLDKYEWRSQRKQSCLKPHAQPKCSKWNGNLPVRKNQLCLISEQGLGDTLQFMRYAIELRNQGLDVSLCAQPTLHSLIQTSGIDPSPLTPQEANELVDGQWIPLLSVPYCLKVSPLNPLITEPYISTTVELINKWAAILNQNRRPLIGINWQGNPNTETTIFKGRSLPLEAFSYLAERTNATFLSLQKGFGSDQLDSCSFRDRFVECQEYVNDTWDFLETAAIIANCDLVITSDTSVAHLAGGMGKTTWLLLKKVPDWRWGLNGDTSFWYPSMRLFRQTERGRWNDVLVRVSKAANDYFMSL